MKWSKVFLYSAMIVFFILVVVASTVVIQEKFSGKYAYEMEDGTICKAVSYQGPNKEFLFCDNEKRYINPSTYKIIEVDKDERSR